MGEKKLKYTTGFFLSFVITSLFNALLVVLKETYTPLKTWMAAVFSHHWIAHGVFVLTLFVVLGLILSDAKIEEKLKLDDKKMSIALIATVIISGIIISGFYLVHIL